jgi:hypothetical protein
MHVYRQRSVRPKDQYIWFDTMPVLKKDDLLGNIYSWRENHVCKMGKARR